MYQEQKKTAALIEVHTVQMDEKLREWKTLFEMQGDEYKAKSAAYQNVTLKLTLCCSIMLKSV